MSFQYMRPPPPPPQQTIVVYPNTVITGQPPSTQSQHSSGSFGKAFLVIAIVIAISTIACCLGRLCNRWNNKSNHPAPRKTGHTDYGHGRPGNDIEFGFHGRNRTPNKPADGMIGREGKESGGSRIKPANMDGALHGNIGSVNGVEPRGAAE